MKQQFAFLKLTEVISGVIILPVEAKIKKSPFVIVNTDNDRGLYIKNLEKEISKYKGLVSADGEKLFHDIETSNLIVFGDSPNFDYRTEMNTITLNSLMGRNVKVYDIVEDYSSIVRRLATYCKGNGIKRKYAYRDEDVTVRVNLVVEEPTWTSRIRQQACECPLLEAKRFVSARPVTKTLVNVYSKPDVSVEKITVHHNWVKIGYNQYDIFVDLFGGEFIILEDGQKMFVKTDRFGKRYLAA